MRLVVGSEGERDTLARDGGTAEQQQQLHYWYQTLDLKHSTTTIHTPSLTPSICIKHGAHVRRQ